MIGNTVNNIKMGKNANINTNGVTWGYNNQEELHREIADHVVNELGELVKILGEY